MNLSDSQLRHAQRRSAAPPRLVPLSSALPTGEPFEERLIAERFRLKQLLGRGALGEVYRAYDLRERRSCAIKLICPGTERRLRIRSRSTARSLPRLLAPHPNIVTLYEMGQDDDGTRFVVMELLHGGDLKGLLRRQERLHLRQALAITRGVGMALQHAHAHGFVHRDLNPGSIFLCQRTTGQEAGTEQVKVLDFAMAYLRAELVEHRGAGKPQGDELLTCEIMMGTPGYLPPEWACTQGGSRDPRGDLWSLAAILYQMLAGQVPFEWGERYPFSQGQPSLAPRPLQQLAPGLPEQIYRSIHIALASRPEDRFSSVGEFLRAVGGLGSLPEARSVDLTLVDEVPLPQRLGLHEESTALFGVPPQAGEPNDVTVMGEMAAVEEPARDAVTIASSAHDTLHEGSCVSLPSVAALLSPEPLKARPDVGSQATQLASEPPPERSRSAAPLPQPALAPRRKLRPSMRRAASRDLLALRPLRLILFFAMGVLAMSLCISLGHQVYVAFRGPHSDGRAQLAKAMRAADDAEWSPQRPIRFSRIPHVTWHPPHPPPIVRRPVFHFSRPAKIF